ncbi:MAG TPA: xanthine dehydrogenase family protein molybdopterin-binding subunit [Bauldia sp.]|nr:xanthine dehydrogenase family protein molybdopterin-binding subunit [Bauldia sp.]
MTWVGRPLPRSEDRALLSGCGWFTADAAGDARAVAFVRSPVARGRILNIERPEGATVVTTAELAGVAGIRPLLHRPDYVAVTQPILADGAVTFAGQPIAAAIAETREEAEDVAEQVFVDIEPEDAVVDLDRALAPGAPLVHAHAAGNLLVEGKIETKGFAEALAGAAATVEIDVRSHRQNATPIEARGGLAAFDRRTGRVTLTCSTQMPHMLRTGIADCLGMPERELRVVAPDVGGGFGQKMALIPEYVFLVWAARLYGGSVAWIEDRRENLTASFHSRDQRHIVRGAFAADGRLLAVEADIRCNVGAYSCYPVTCGVEPLMAMAEFPGPYDVREYKVRSRGVTTNTCPMAPYRGVSRPAITLSMERLMDCAAARLGIEAAEIRRRNLVTDFPYKTATGITYDEGSYRQSLELAEETVNLAAFRERQKAEWARGRYLGIGFAVFNERSGYGTPAFAARSMDITPGYERVEIAMDPSGHVELRIGASPHGQGLQQALRQLVADVLGITPDTIHVIHGDTDATPYGWGTFASRSMVISGGACKLAAEKLATKLRAASATLLQADPARITLAGGEARAEGGGHVGIAEVARAAYHKSHRFGNHEDSGLMAFATYDPPGTYSNACHAALVEVDVETGGVRIERFIAVEDAGLLVNPMIADGQVHGGIAQGIANALLEEIVYDPAGNILTASLADFLPPTASEVPPIEIRHLETITDASITKAKGLGEGGAIGAPAAVINAISDALRPLGVELFEMPATPRRIRAAIRSATGKTAA